MSISEVYNLLIQHISVKTDNNEWKEFDSMFNYNMKNNRVNFKKANYIVWIHLGSLIEENDILFKENKALTQENEKNKFAHSVLINILQENKKDYETNLCELSKENLKLQKELEQTKLILDSKEKEYQEQIKLLEEKIKCSETVVIRKNKRVIQTDYEYSKMIKRQKN